MTSLRDDVLDWAEQGRIAPAQLRRALDLAGAVPGAQDWRTFLDRLLLWLGVVMLAAGVIFFFAYNWQDLGRFARFALVEVPLFATLALLWWKGPDHLAGRGALLGASLLAGALLALIGQTYQTGADTFELFAAWAVAILPWTLVGRFPALWILWIALVNLAVTLYFQAFHGLFGIVFGPERQLWVLFAVNLIALAIWEGAAAAGIAWLRERWAARLLATASGACITALAVFDIVDWSSSTRWGGPGWLAWLGATYYVYRRVATDLFVLAGGVLSLIVVVATFLGRHLLEGRAEAGAFLLIGMVVIGLSAAGGIWLKNVANERNSA